MAGTGGLVPVTARVVSVHCNWNAENAPNLAPRPAPRADPDNALNESSALEGLVLLSGDGDRDLDSVPDLAGAETETVTWGVKLTVPPDDPPSRCTLTIELSERMHLIDVSTGNHFPTLKMHTLLSPSIPLSCIGRLWM